MVFRFLIVGGCSTLIDFLVYMGLSIVIPISFAKALSMIVASFFSYFANKLFTFKDKNKTNVRYIISFYIVFIANLCANVGVNALVYNLTGKKSLAFIFATAIGMSVNFLGQKFFVFKNDK